MKRVFTQTGLYSHFIVYDDLLKDINIIPPLFTK